MKILHCYADEGVESEALNGYGDVVRVGIDPRDTNNSTPIQADAKWLPFCETVTFDLGVFHPPCQKWTPGAHRQGTTDNHDNLLPVTREIAREYCDEWIIENVPNAPLNDPVTLNGGMFGSPLHYERAFETSYHVPQPRNQARLTDPPQRIQDHHDTGGFQGQLEMWKTLKGYSGEYNARSFKRSAIPRVYIDYLMRHYLKRKET